MKKFLISLKALAALSLIGMAIIAIYMTATYFFSGVINELIILISLIILLTIAWYKYEDFIFDIWDKYFDTEFIVGHVVSVAVYASLIIFIYHRGISHTIPAYLWIITGTGIILMDNTITRGRHLWHERLFLVLTALFLLSMYSNYDSLYIWLLAAFYVVVTECINVNIYFFKNDKIWNLYILAAISLACIILTIIQFWTPIISALTFSILGISIWKAIGIIGGICLAVMVLKIVIKKKSRKTLLKLQKANKEKEETEKRKAAEAEKLENERVKNQRLAQAIFELESGKISWELLNEITSLKANAITGEKKYWEKVLSLSLKTLVHISDVKQQFVWNDNQFIGALQIMDDIASHCFDDETLITLYERLQSFQEDYIDYRQEYEGYNLLKRRIESNCSNLQQIYYKR